MEDIIRVARDQGYVETLLGRRRYLNDINSHNSFVRGFAERNAINAPLQGTAADIIKIAMINIHRKLRDNNLHTRMILQVHDELVFDIYEPELEQVKEIVIREMENAYPLSIPLVVDTGTGTNWLEAH
jgi:DNA polymerase-1